MTEVPIYVLAGQSNAHFAGIDNRIVEQATAGGGAFEFVKSTLGGTSLFANSNPDWDPDSVNELFDNMIASVKAAVANVTAQGAVAHVHLLWMQGERDNERTQQEYHDKLAAFMDAVRAELNGTLLDISMTMVAKGTSVRAAQQQYLDEHSEVHGFDTIGAPTWDGVHYERSMQFAIAEDFYEQISAPQSDLPGYHSLVKQASTSVSGPFSVIDAAEFLDFSFSGGNVNYKIDTYSGDDTITTGSGNDQIVTRGNDDVVYSGAGNDFVDLGDHNDYCDSGSGNDYVLGRSGRDTLILGDGNDIGKAGGQDDIVLGCAGDDNIDGGPGNDNLDGGDGLDTLTYIDVLGGVTVNLLLAGAQDTKGAGIDTLTGFENLTGSDFSDILAGNGAANKILGGGGNDQIYGQPGNDIVDGGAGDDALSGGSGIDTSSYASAQTGVHVSLAVTSAQDTVGAGRDTLIYFENLAGSEFDDQLDGDAGSNAISGGGGNDILNSGEGDDTIEGGAGNDSIQGGMGTDTANYAAATGAVKVDLNLTATQNTVGAGLDTLVSIENLIGSNFNDTLTGDAGNNVIAGGLGDDLIDGGAGDDNIQGSTGTDTATYINAAASVAVSLNTALAQNTGGAGIDTLSGIENLVGSALGDTLTGSSGSNMLNGANGNDLIAGLDGADILIGGAGDDTLDGGRGSDTANYSSNGSAVTVSLAIAGPQDTVGAGVDTLIGIENLTGSNFNDTLTGDAASNVIEGGLGDDIIQGGGGADTATYINAAAGVVVSLATLVAQDTGAAGLDTLAGIENLTGSNFNDTLTGDAGNNAIEGGAGNDTIQGGNGADTATYINATAGVVVSLATLVAQNTGGAGTDTLAGIENLAGSNFNDTLTGDAGNNVLEGGAGNDTIRGGTGTDTATYVSAIASVVVSLNTALAQNTGGAGSDTLSSIENLKGSGFNDTLTGNGGSNALDGSSGNDLMFGLDGADTLIGGAGDDTLDGGLGIDTANYGANGSAVTISLAITTAQNIVGAGLDTLIGIENLTGSNFNDTLTGDSGNNVISGGAGVDILAGGAGNDTLIGGSGINTMTGGAGADSFRFDINEIAVNRDVMTDFEHGIDHVEIERSAFGGFASSLASELNPAAFMLGPAATTAAQRMIYDQASGNLYYDADGNGAAAQIPIALLLSKPVLGVADFVLI